MANAKFPIGQNLFFTSRTLTEDIYSKNRIDFQISAWTTDGVSADGSLSAGAYAVGLKTLTQSPPNTNGQSTIIYPTGGDVPTGGIWSPAPVPWDACNGGFVSASQPYGKGTITAANIFKAAPNTTITKGEGYYTQAQPSKVAPKLVEYKETISYEIDNKIAVFYPKAIGQAPVAQQTGNPVLNIIQAGYATTFGQSVADAPKPPAPFVGNGSKNFIVGAPMIQADSPQTVGDGTSNRYTIHWRYIIRHVGTPIESLDEINFRFPIDQQRPQIPADQYEVKGEFPENPIIQGGQLPQA